MNHLRYTQKFTLIGIVLILPVIILMYYLSSHMRGDIEFSQREQTGVKYINNLKKILEHSQQHRGMVHAYLNGDASFKEKIILKQTELDEDMKYIDELDYRLGLKLNTTDPLRELKKSWLDLKQSAFTLQPDDSFELHTAFISDVSSLMVHVANISNLILDPELDSYYLMNSVVNKLPRLIENIGQLRGIGTGMLVVNQRTESMKANYLLRSTEALLEEINYDIQIASVENPQIGKRLEPLGQEVTSGINELLYMIETEVLGYNRLDITPAAFFDTATHAIDALIKLYDTEIEMLEKILQQRVDQFYSYRNMIIIIVFALILLSIYLFSGFYLSVTRSVSTLENTAELVSKGNLSVRVQLDTKDELSAIGNVMNQMIESFDEMITRRTEELLQKSDKLTVVGELAAGIAHEIRNPLTSLKGFIQLLSKKTNDNPEYYNIMMTELERINSIVSEMLVLAKPQVQNMKPHDVRALLESVITLLDTLAIMNNVQISMDFEQDIPPIICDENRIKQVFINIIKNAIEAMADGGILLIRVRPYDENHILIRFIDQGNGISEERIAKLGEPFYTDKEKGTGLGLTVSMKIIHEHQGNLYIKSELNKGTTVDIILPI